MAGASDPQLDLVTCCLCYDIFNHTDKLPKGLPCMHTFCLECLEKFAVDKVGLQLPCPLCQRKFSVPTEGAKAIPTNITVKHLLDTTPRKSPCGQKCQVHGKEAFEFVCKTCHLPLCSTCMINVVNGPHARHTLENMQDILAEMMMEYKESKDKTEKIDDEINTEYESIGHECEVSKDEIIAEAEERADQVIAEAVGWKNNIVRKITAAFADTNKEIRLKQDSARLIRERLIERMKQIEEGFENLDTENCRANLDMLREHIEEFKARIPTSQVTFGQLSTNFTVDLGEFDMSSSVHHINGKGHLCRQNIIYLL